MLPLTLIAWHATLLELSLPISSHRLECEGGITWRSNLGFVLV